MQIKWKILSKIFYIFHRFIKCTSCKDTRFAEMELSLREPLIRRDCAIAQSFLLLNPSVGPFVICAYLKADIA